MFFLSAFSPRTGTDPKIIMIGAGIGLAALIYHILKVRLRDGAAASRRHRYGLVGVVAYFSMILVSVTAAVAAIGGCGYTTKQLGIELTRHSALIGLFINVAILAVPVYLLLTGLGRIDRWATNRMER